THFAAPDARSAVCATFVNCAIWTSSRLAGILDGRRRSSLAPLGVLALGPTRRSAAASPGGPGAPPPSPTGIVDAVAACHLKAARLECAGTTRQQNRREWDTPRARRGLSRTTIMTMDTPGLVSIRAATRSR